MSNVSTEAEPLVMEEDETIEIDNSSESQPKSNPRNPSKKSKRMSASEEKSSQTTQVCADVPLPARVEAVLLSTDRPLSDGKIAELLGITLAEGGTKAIREAIDSLNQQYTQTNRAFRIEAVAGGRQVLTTPEFGPVLHRLHQARIQTRLSPAALETLAIVAYRQPVLRADVEAIRGVASGEVLRTLMERRLVKIVGRAEELGRPMLYGTTKEFLRIFGLSGLDDLPNAKELRDPSVKKDRIAKPVDHDKVEEMPPDDQAKPTPSPDPQPGAEASEPRT